MVEIKRRERPIIKVQGLHKYFSKTHIIKGVDLDVYSRDVIAIMGPSGGGKSTFLRCLNFIEEPSAGSIEICGIKIDAKEAPGQWEKKLQKIRHQAAMVFQDFNLFENMTVMGNITAGAITVKEKSKDEAIAKAEMLLDRIGLLARRDDFPRQLATGEQQQVAIARSLCMEPQVMLFDDPTSALDPILVHELANTMTRLANEGMTMIVVSNQPDLIRHVANQVIFMDNGVWLEMAPPDEIFANPEKDRTRQFVEKISLKEIAVKT